MEKKKKLEKKKRNNKNPQKLKIMIHQKKNNMKIKHHLYLP